MNAYFLALLAAFSFALGSVLQQRGTLETDAPEGDPNFLREIIRKPIWLLGGVMQIIGWVLQAAALEKGSLVVVQSLTSLSLVFALPLGVRITHQQVGRRSIIGACVTLLGIITFVAIGQPQGGTSQPSTTAWWTSVFIITTLVGILAWLAHRRRGTISAAMFATAAGLGFAFQAAVTKVFVTLIGSGLSAILTSWTTYALIISALAGFGLQQSALKTGYLAPAMAACNATTLITSVILGVTVFQESISRDPGLLSPAMIGLTLAVIGVLLLTSPERGKLETISG